jgi:hypothetical protein
MNDVFLLQMAAPITIWNRTITNSELSLLLQEQSSVFLWPFFWFAFFSSFLFFLVVVLLVKIKCSCYLVCCFPVISVCLIRWGILNPCRLPTDYRSVGGTLSFVSHHVRLFLDLYVSQSALHFQTIGWLHAFDYRSVFFKFLFLALNQFFVVFM